MARQTQHNKLGLYELTTGKPVTSLTPFRSPLKEYRHAFEDAEQEFLHYYTLERGRTRKRSLSRGEFWNLACGAAAYLSDHGISQGNRIAHCFSSNNLYDLVFRLAAVLVGYTPVTINWQADSNETVLYKARATGARAVLYDRGFADRVEQMKPDLPPFLLRAEEVEGYRSGKGLVFPSPSYEDERMVVFTSGTTSRPKGVSLSHRSYLVNRLTFEQYFGLSPETRLDLLLVNPLHHANSTALADWGMRRKGAIIHLVERYTTDYWKILVEVASRKRDLLVASLVARHIDFLEALSAGSRLPVQEAEIEDALSQTDILIGSAPVGPTTIKRVLKFSYRLPHVRFGSTETCLQVMATPTSLSEDELREAFEAGWAHQYQGANMVGYYIGWEHFPFTRVMVVRSVDPGSQDYLQPCEVGEGGYLITQGANIMSGYVGDAEATKAVFQKGWYTGLKDIAFALRNKADGQLDYYWLSRDSELLIRGGAKYAYDQIAAELSKVVVNRFELKPEQFQLAVIGLRVASEHEDSCCVTIELSPEASHLAPRLEAEFLEQTRTTVSKGSRPDYIRLAPIPRTFKGSILYPKLRQDCLETLGKDRLQTRD